jgi:hypothetical protein
MRRIAVKSHTQYVVLKAVATPVCFNMPISLFRGSLYLSVIFACLILLFCGDPARAQLWEAPAAPKALPPSPEPKPLNSRSNYIPITGKERWNLYTKGTLLSPGPYVVGLGLASVAQASNEPKEWGGDWGGYGKRVASTYGIILTEETIHQSMATALRTDPRYLRCDCKNGWHRSWNAIEMTLLTRDNRGRLTIDAAQIAGAYGSGMISTFWYPSRYSPTAQGLRIGNLNLAVVAGVNIIREFSPELKRVFSIKH